MSTNYQIEDLENEACKKSNAARRALAGAGLAAAGAGAAFAADAISAEPEPETVLTADELADAVTDGVTENDMPEAAAPEESKPEEVHVYHHNVEEKPAAPAEPDVDFNNTTAIHNQDGELIASIDEGKINGTDFALYDVDGDGKADFMAFDANGNHIYERDEIIDVQSENISMQDTSDGLHVVVNTGDTEWIVEPAEPEPFYDEDSLADINNDFQNEKTGEVYGEDLAENNDDYRNDEDMMQYASLDEEASDEFGGYADATPFDTEGDYTDNYELGDDTEMAMEYDGMPENDLETGFDDMACADDMAFDSQPEDLSAYDLA